MFRTFLVWVLAVFCAECWSDEAGQLSAGMTLESAFLAAKDNAPAFRAAKYRVDAADAQRSVARGSLLPQVSLFGEWSDNKLRYDGPLADTYGELNYPGERYGFQFRQSLINMSNWREFERRNALLDRSEKEFFQAEIDLLQSVAQTYLSVLVADETVHQFTAESEALKEQWQAAEALYQRSLIPITQLLETQTRYESVSADLIQSEGDAAIAREELAAFLGFRNFALMPMGAEVELHPRPVSIEQATQFAIERSPVIAAAKDGSIAAKAAVEREKGSWWPEVDLVFNQQYSDVGFDNLSSPPRTSDSVSIAVNYPLIQGGSGSARIRGAWADYYGAQQELEAARRSVETQTRSAWLQFESAKKRVLATQRAVDSAEVNVEASKRSVKAGSARVTDVLLALSQRTRAKRDHSFAQFQRASAWLALELISGSDVQITVSELSDALLAHAPVSANAYTP